MSIENDRYKLSFVNWFIPGMILCLASGIQVYHAHKFVMGYDEAWNLYYSKIHPFLKSFLELQFNAHPPFASLFLRIPILFGDTIFWPRLGSIIPSIASIVFIVLILKKLRVIEPLPSVVAFILAISHTYVNISVCVRGYALMMFCIVAALYYYIAILQNIKHTAPRKVFLFSMFAVLAMWTEYCSAFFMLSLFASFVLCLLVGTVSFADGIKIWIKNWDSGMILILGGVGILFYFKWTMMSLSQGHVTTHYLGPEESIAKYAIRGIANNLRYFTPIDINHSLLIIAIATGFLFLSGGLIYYYAKSKPDPARASILITHIGIWVLLFIAGAKGAYPFGGSMRHQFILFPFIILSLTMVLDELFRYIQNKKVPYLWGVIIVTTAIYLSVEAFKGAPVEEFPPYPLFQNEYSGFQEKIADSSTFYLTNYTQFAFFYHMLDWRLEYKKTFDDSCFLFEASKGNKKVQIIVDRFYWLPSIPLNETFLDRLGHVLNFAESDSLWLFSVAQGIEFKKEIENGGLISANSNDRVKIKIVDPFFSGDGYGYQVRLN